MSAPKDPDRWVWQTRVTPTGCIEWTGKPEPNGYGRLSINGKRQMVHRLSYEKFVGPIPEGLVIDHLCKNTICVNPLHLDAVTNGENVLRGDGPFAINKRKTHCAQGHELPEGRRCKECNRINAKAWYHRHREEAAAAALRRYHGRSAR